MHLSGRLIRQELYRNRASNLALLTGPLVTSRVSSCRLWGGAKKTRCTCKELRRSPCFWFVCPYTRRWMPPHVHHHPRNVAKGRPDRLRSDPMWVYGGLTRSPRCRLIHFVPVFDIGLLQPPNTLDVPVKVDQRWFIGEVLLGVPAVSVSSCF